jgi:hypothetical protein
MWICGYFNKGSTEYVLNFKFQRSLGRNDYISTRKESEEEKFQSILICFSLQIVLFDCLHLPGAHTPTYKCCEHKTMEFNGSVFVMKNK